MKIVNARLDLLRSDYGNYFFFFLPILNVCIYKQLYTTVSMGWLIFHFSFYMDYRKKRAEWEDAENEAIPD